MMRLWRSIAGIVMVLIGLLIGFVGLLILLSTVFTHDAALGLINVPLCAALFGAAVGWVYFGGKLLRRGGVKPPHKQPVA